MKRTFLAIVLPALFGGLAWAEEPVYFPDAGLKGAVEDELWIWDPTPTDMLGLISLNGASWGIGDLTGLEYAINLQTLVLRWNWISDISALAGLTNLQYLDIHDNRISDLSPLSGLSSLRTLILRFNRISDISALAALTSLECLDLRGNPLDREAYDTYLPQIVANNPGIDLSYDLYAQCQVLLSSTAGGSVIDPGEGVFTYDNGALVYLEAAADPGWVFVRWSGSLSHTSNPTFLSVNEDHNIQAEFTYACDGNCPQDSVYFADDALETAVEETLSVLDPTPTDMLGLTELECAQRGITDLTGLEYAANLRELDLHDNQISDISALSALTSLTYVDLRENPLSQNARDVHIPVIAANNPGVDLRYDGPVRHRLSIRATPGGSVTTPGEGQFTCDDGQAILLTAKADPGFVFVNWSGSYQSTTNPALLTVHRDHDIQANFAALSACLYVDDDAPNDPGPGDPNDGDPNENGTAEYPYDTIQEAIDVAAEGATVVVHPGTYHESINLLGKSIHLTGIEPNGAPLPVIDGDGAGPIVSFVSGEDPNCLVIGFVLTAGKGEAAGAIICSQSSPTVANCLIVGNRATEPQGAAVYCEDSQAVFDNCTVADNIGGEQGTGLMLVDSDVVLSNSIVWGNTPNQIVLSGDGVPSIVYSDIAGGWLDRGNIGADPRFAQRGYWVTSADPNELLWIAGDYHLQSQAGRWDPKTQVWVQDDVTSPCIDAGDPAAPVGAEPAPNRGIVNLGAYGGTTHASKTY